MFTRDWSGPEPFQTELDWIGFCLHGTVLELVLNGPKWIQNWTCRKLVQFWILSKPVPKRSCVNRSPIRFDLDRIRLELVPCKHSLIDPFGPVPKQSRVNRSLSDPIFGPDLFGSVWNRSCVNIALLPPFCLDISSLKQYI